MGEGKKILIIPDCQVKEGVPLDHLTAVGHYIVDKKPDIIVCLGDFWDMESLSSYEKTGSKKLEGARYQADVAIGNHAMEKMLIPLYDYNDKRRWVKKKKYTPEMHFLMGNHENRIQRVIEDTPITLEGSISYNDLDLDDWIVHEYMEVVTIQGILFSHSFANPFSLLKGALGGTIDNKLQKIGSSFVQGHQQQLQFGVRYPPNRQLIGIVAGAFYQHDEDYLGKQGNDYWRGCIVLNDTKEGYGDLMLLSLDYLKRKYL